MAMNDFIYIYKYKNIYKKYIYCFLYSGITTNSLNELDWDFPGGAVVKNPPDPTCRGATKPVRHNYWAHALEPVSHNYWAHMPQLLKPMHLEPVLRNKRSHHNEKPSHHNKE